MRIAIFSECYLPWQNGAVTSIIGLRESLRELGHTVYLFAPGKPMPSDDTDIFRLPDLPFPAHPYHYARPMAKMPVDFASLNVDVVHSQHPFTVGRMGARLAKLYGIPLVYTVHSMYDLMARHAAFPPFRSVGPPLLRSVQKRYCALVDQVIVPSVNTAEALRDCGVTKPIEVVPSGVLPMSSRPGARERIRAKLRISPETPLLLYVGRLCRVKHLDVLLEAVALLDREQLPFRLVLVGEGFILEELQQQVAELGIGHRVTFAGAQPHGEVADWYAAADIFTLSSPSETQGLVLVEAMMAGLPCVAIDRGGPSEVVAHGETGLLVPFETQAFADAIKELLLSPEKRRQFGLRGKARADDFSALTMARRVLDVYSRVESHAVGVGG